MRIGIIGVGMVGGALMRYLEKHGHEVLKYDPNKGLKDDLKDSDAIFICIPVRPELGGQDQSILEQVVEFAKSFTSSIFIKSTVLPGTNDRLHTTACPEFLTARIADEEMNRLPILVGPCDALLIREIFKGKPITMMLNQEAELAKFAHNCFGAVKVTFFNMIYKLCQDAGLDYEYVKRGFLMSGFINEPHTRVPGPDGQLGYGGMCFPENMEAMIKWLNKNGHEHNFKESLNRQKKYDYETFMRVVSYLNDDHRGFSK